MRAYFLAVPILFLVVQLAAQQPPERTTVSDILKKMGSSKMDERENAFDEGSNLLASENPDPKDIER